MVLGLQRVCDLRKTGTWKYPDGYGQPICFLSLVYEVNTKQDAVGIPCECLNPVDLYHPHTDFWNLFGDEKTMLL